MSATLQTEKGTITYSDDFIARLVGITATECYGVVGMSAQKATDGIMELLKGENLKKGVKIFTDESHELTIQLFIIVEYGISIAAAAASLIETVKYTLESTTGLSVKEVDVMVNGVRI